MNLKEAFRFQNKLQGLIGEAEYILNNKDNITKTERTYLRKKVMAEADNETLVTVPESEYANKINTVCEFLLFVLNEKEKLAKAIRAAKNSLDVDMDTEVGMNSIRQELAGIFRKMTEIKNSEILESGGGTGYRFNSDGNQVSYRCDVKRVTTINFDRNKIKNYATKLNKISDETSITLDNCLINSSVDYTLPFDVNDNFDCIFETFEASA